ncbi:MAG: hypothetical protein ACFFCP_08210 [Promethearchaeota archaeon]
MIKKRVSLLTLALVLCLMIPVMSSANHVDFVISQAGGWSDDFNHGNITESGWSVQGFNLGDPPIPGSITAEDYTMRVHSEKFWSEAYRTSSVAYGSWAFDVYCVNTRYNRSYIAFVSGSPPLVPEDLDFPFEYGIITVVGEYTVVGAGEYYRSAFLLYRRTLETMYLSVIGSYDVEEVSGWYHINITRDYDGNFEVYINDTLGITVTDTTHTTCDLFTFTAEAGYALDNIVVVPTPSGGIPDMTLLLVVGGGIAVVVIIGVVIRLRKRTD